MADLHISAQILDNLRSTLTRISADLDGACRVLRNADATGLGAEPLVSRVHDFADDWGYGIGQIGKHADDCVSMLDHIGKGFDDVDRKLKQQLQA